MGEIYQNTRSVQVWLGSQVDESGLAMALIQQLQSRSQQEDFLKDIGKWGGHVVYEARKWIP